MLLLSALSAHRAPDVMTQLMHAKLGSALACPDL